ncbi:MAG: CHAT domain-containing protein [Cyanobacteria bacterium P01_F01_bin.150]
MNPRSLTDTETRLANPDTSTVLGLGLTQAKAGFNPLPAVSEELDAIVRSDASDPQGIYPGQVYLDEAFSLTNLEETVSDHQVLHVATHAEFVPGRPDDSYILLGNGDKLTPSYY